MRRGTTARVLVAMAMAGAALAAGATAAQAAPPPGWGPNGDGSAVEYDLAGVTWTHHGRYTDAPGNWHTGYLNVEEDDDGITGWTYDWQCPAGVQPPSATDNDQTSMCKEKAGLYFENIQDWDSATIDFTRNRMDVVIDADGYDGFFGGFVRTVHIDVTLKGLGKSTITSDESGPVLDWSEIWYNVKAWGHVDGHRIAGPNTDNTAGRMGYWLDGWTRNP